MNKLAKSISLASISATVLFVGCQTVGKDYEAPVLEESKSIENLLGESAEPGMQIDQDLLSNWWKRFNDPKLEDLIAKALDGSYTIEEARARIRQSRALLGIADAALYPTVDATGNYNRAKSSKNLTGSSSWRSVYSVGVDASWEIDIVGGNRRNLEAASADLESIEESLKSSWVTLCAEIASNYITLRTQQQSLRVANDNLKSQMNTFEIIKSRYDSGLSDQLAVHQAAFNLENTRATIPTYASKVEAALNSLAVLIGVEPGSLHEQLGEIAKIPKTDMKNVVGIAANVVRQRPDIRVAERKLAAQHARIGAAQADLYPRFILSGSIGLESLKHNNLISSHSKTYGFGPNISWPIFRAGSIQNNIKAQGAYYDVLLAQYKNSVSKAIQEVRDALVSFDQEQKRLASLEASELAANSAVAVSDDLYKNGLSDFSNVLDSQRSLLSIQANRVASEGQISQNLVSLFKALGGGWIPLHEQE